MRSTCQRRAAEWGIEAVGCWVGEHWRVFLLIVAVGGAALSRWVDRLSGFWPDPEKRKN